MVNKFGGSSVADAERIQNVANILADQYAEGHKVFVVVSAIGGVTDHLYQLIDLAVSRSPETHYVEKLHFIENLHAELANELLPPEARNPFLSTLRSSVKDLKDLLRATWIARSVSHRIRDLVVGHGELWSAQMLWALLRSKHTLTCSWMDTRDVLIARQSDANQMRKIVEFEHSAPLLEQWKRSNPTNLVVATGFICQDKDGVPSTLGRNGSDYTASVFANMLQATELNIWTDVDGVFSADPRIVKDAIIIPEISYKEASELAYFGAKVLHPDTMAPIIDSSIPMRIRNTFNKDFPGTLVHASKQSIEKSDEPYMPLRDMAGVKGFTTVQNVSIINIEGTGMIGVPGIASRAFKALFAESVSVILIAQASSEFSICIAIPSSQCKSATDAVTTAFRAELMDGLISSISTVPECSILAMVGELMQQRPGVSSRLFGSLTRAGVNIIAMAQGSSEHNISVVVDAASESRALRAAHAAFYLSDQTVSVGVIGPGVVGGAFLKQIQSQLDMLDNKFCVDLRVRGIATSKRMIFGEPIDLAQDLWNAELASDTDSKSLDLDKFADHIQDTTLPHAVIIDCTASAVISSCYEKWLERGIHIVTPNKKANSGPLEYYYAMRRAQRRLNSHFFYEATVGAGLPIISSIRDLLRTGDVFLGIEGVFSGTLSFIFNAFDGSEPFSSVVSKAKANGYTEPDPRDDLSGMDVARKVVILAREIGLDLELSDVPVKSLVPTELQDEKISVEEFMKRLPDFDSELTAMSNEAAQAGELLRYVGLVDAQTGKCSVELRKYSKSHPFGRLQGSDNIVSFRTKRYDAQPLVVQGPGAGADVTAAGVFADLLRLTAHLGAPSAEEY